MFLKNIKKILHKLKMYKNDPLTLVNFAMEKTLTEHVSVIFLNATEYKEILEI